MHIFSLQMSAYVHVSACIMFDIQAHMHYEGGHIYMYLNVSACISKQHTYMLHLLVTVFLRLLLQQLGRCTFTQRTEYTQADLQFSSDQIHSTLGNAVEAIEGCNLKVITLKALKCLVDVACSLCTLLAAALRLSLKFDQ
jgi:hypothetical protein